MSSKNILLSIESFFGMLENENSNISHYSVIGLSRKKFSTTIHEGIIFCSIGITQIRKLKRYK